MLNYAFNKMNIIFKTKRVEKIMELIGRMSYFSYFFKFIRVLHNRSIFDS